MANRIGVPTPARNASAGTVSGSEPESAAAALVEPRLPKRGRHESETQTTDNVGGIAILANRVKCGAKGVVQLEFETGRSPRCVGHIKDFLERVQTILRERGGFGRSSHI